MKLASVLTPMSAENLQLAAQCGVEGIVIRYPGSGLEELRQQQQAIRHWGMEAMSVEGHLPIEQIKMGCDQDGRELALMKELIRNMGELEIPVLCYNFMAGTDWVRTTLDYPERGGAKVTAFSLADAKRAVSLSETTSAADFGSITAERLWSNLTRFLEELVPFAERCGVMLAMHPDDPPLPQFQGRERIMNSVAGFQRLLQVVSSPNNGICFCVGTFAAMGVDIPTAIATLGPHIRYVHFRDVRGAADSFVETFHDNGPTDMASVIRALRDVGFTGPLRPDHVPQLVGEDDGAPGYTMLGRLFAFGYIRGLLHGTESA
jgi:mannonate dehydratase